MACEYAHKIIYYHNMCVCCIQIQKEMNQKDRKKR